MKKKSRTHLLQKIAVTVTVLALILLSPISFAFAKDVSLVWDANQEPDIAGYKVYYGSSSGSYNGTDANIGPSPIDIGNTTSASMVGLDDSKSHYFTVTAYNFSGEESSYAAEVNSPPKTYNDFDGDGYDVTVDCDDYNAAINPGATEIPNNGIDENCNGMADDAQVNIPAGAIEAENGSLVSPMQKVADSSASNGFHIQSSTVSSGSASFNFNISEPGTYKVVARAHAADAGSNSFFVNIDNAGEFVWNLTANNAWSTVDVSSGGSTYEVELQSGSHSISFRCRERNTKLDYFYLVKVGGTTITDADQDGYDIYSDCNDNDPSINAGATEIPGNGIDENCNGMADDAVPATGVTLSPSAASPSSIGTSIDFTAAGSGGSGPYEYRFYLNDGSGWSTAKHYSTDNTWTWDTTSAAAGSYTVLVWVRNVGSSSNYEAALALTYTIEEAAVPATGVSLSPSVASPSLIGTSIDFTAAGSGGSGPYEYRFYLNDGSGWSTAQHYSLDNTWTWNTTSVAAGDYTVLVWVRNVGSSSNYEAARAMTYSLAKGGEANVTDADQDGYDVTVDCDDYNAAINPGATEIPNNGIDENCNGMADDAVNVDTTAPTIISLTPTDGTILKGRWCDITIEAIDNVIVMKTEIFIDGILVLEEPGGTAQLQLDLRTLDNGSHNISGKAYDQDGNVAMKTITVVK